MFVDCLRKLMRARYGLIREVSNATGIPYGTLNNFCSGQGLSVDRIDKVARALGKRIVIAED